MDALILGLPSARQTLVSGLTDALPDGGGENWAELAVHLGSRFLEDF